VKTTTTRTIIPAEPGTWRVTNCPLEGGTPELSFERVIAWRIDADQDGKDGVSEYWTHPIYHQVGGVQDDSLDSTYGQPVLIKFADGSFINAEGFKVCDGDVEALAYLVAHERKPKAA
jgi:hypothetical protein